MTRTNREMVQIFVWTARRKAIHESEFQSPLSTHYFVRKFLADLELSKKPNVRRCPGPAQMPNNQKWSPPPINSVKFNVDGACSRDNMIGSVAVVARDHDGKYIGSAAMVFPGIVDPPTLEALACREALDLADDLGLRRILISSDCKQVVQDITDGSGGRYATVIKEIQMHSIGS